jgi:hypothetical protein
MTYAADCTKRMSNVPTLSPLSGPSAAQGRQRQESILVSPTNMTKMRLSKISESRAKEAMQHAIAESLRKAADAKKQRQQTDSPSSSTTQDDEKRRGSSLVSPTDTRSSAERRDMPRVLQSEIKELEELSHSDSAPESSGDENEGEGGGQDNEGEGQGRRLTGAEEEEQQLTRAVALSLEEQAVRKPSQDQQQPKPHITEKTSSSRPPQGDATEDMLDEDQARKDSALKEGGSVPGLSTPKPGRKPSESEPRKDSTRNDGNDGKENRRPPHSQKDEKENQRPSLPQSRQSQHSLPDRSIPDRSTDPKAPGPRKDSERNDGKENQRPSRRTSSHCQQSQEASPDRSANPANQKRKACQHEAPPSRSSSGEMDTSFGRHRERSSSPKKLPRGVTKLVKGLLETVTPYFGGRPNLRKGNSYTADKSDSAGESISRSSTEGEIRQQQESEAQQRVEARPDVRRENDNSTDPRVAAMIRKIGDHRVYGYPPAELHLTPALMAERLGMEWTNGVSTMDQFPENLAMAFLGCQLCISEETGQEVQRGRCLVCHRVHEPRCAGSREYERGWKRLRRWVGEQVYFVRKKYGYNRRVPVPPPAERSPLQYTSRSYTEVHVVPGDEGFDSEVLEEYLLSSTDESDAECGGVEHEGVKGDDAVEMDEEDVQERSEVVESEDDAPRTTQTQGSDTATQENVGSMTSQGGHAAQKDTEMDVDTAYEADRE